MTDPDGFAVVLFVALITICAWLRVNGSLQRWAFAVDGFVDPRTRRHLQEAR